MNPHRLEKQVTLAAKRATKKSNHALTHEEALRLQIQIVPTWLRWTMGIVGIVAILTAIQGWLFETGGANLFFGLGGLLLLCFGVFGIRRTLSAIAEGISSQYIVDLPALAIEVSLSVITSLGSD